MKYGIIFVLLASLLVGCTPKATVSKKEAVDTFIQRTNKENEAFAGAVADKSLARKIIQFTYGPDSLKNSNFLEYLLLAKANLSSDVIKQLKQHENAYMLLKDTKFSQGLSYKDNLQSHQKKVDLYKGLAETTSVTFSNINLSQALDSLAGSAGFKVVGDFEGLQLQGQYSGSLFEILSKIAQKNKLLMSFSPDFSTLVFSPTKLPNNPEIDPNFIKEAFIAGKDLQILNAIMVNLSKTNGQYNTPKHKRYIAQLKTKHAKAFIDNILFKLKEEELLEAKNLESSKFRKALVAYAKVTNIKGSEQVKTAAIFKPSLNEGDETAIEKFSVYNDTPDSMEKILSGHPVFKLNCTALAPAAPAAPAAVVSIASPPSKLPDCVIFSKDTTGIVASGYIRDIQLVERFISDQDRPIKQAMIEVFILEMNKDWQRTIKNKLTVKEGANPGTSTFVSDVAGIALTTGANIKTLGGNLRDIGMLIDLIESNAIGRTISNPVILVKDGETGSISKTRTVRKEQPTAGIVGEGGVVTPSPPEIVELSSPLELSIKATINEHNDNIELDFSFTETVLDSDNVLSPDTKNEIKSKLIAQPGQIITMAGLYKEKSSSDIRSFPGIPDVLRNFLGPLIAIFGGGSAEQKAGSELLVFINASVITNKNMDKTMKRVHY